MKSRNREINVFNMSALDLFASALGAFILIAVILFPYFPNTGDSAEKVEAVKKMLAEARGALEQKEDELEEQRRQNKAMESKLKTAQLPHLDLVIALDITGSMGAQVDGLKNEIKALSAILNQWAASFSIGVIAFGDRKWDTPLTVFQLRAISGSVANNNAMESFVNGINIRMGLGAGSNSDDGSEAIGSALRRAIAMPWRMESERKVIVIISDHPAYKDEIQTTYSAARNFAGQGGGRRVSTVVVGQKNAETDAYLERLAKEGRGTAVPGGGSMTANILMALL